MRSNYFIHDTPQENEGGCGLWIFLALLVGAAALASLLFAVRLSFESMGHAKYLEQAQPTQGVLIERIRIPRDRNAPLFYLRYKYENEGATAECSINPETRLTPSDKGCRMTIDQIQVNEKAYRAAKVPSKIDLLYVPSQEVSWSQIEGHTPRHRRSMILAVMASVLSLLLGKFTLKIIRTL